MGRCLWIAGQVRGWEEHVLDKQPHGDGCRCQISNVCDVTTHDMARQDAKVTGVKLPIQDVTGLDMNGLNIRGRLNQFAGPGRQGR